MTGLIQEIQTAAINDSTKIEHLLRMVKIAAAKLSIKEVESWVDAELNGYNDDVPDYRILSGQLVIQNEYTGAWQVVFSHDEELTKIMHQTEVRQPLGSLREIVYDQNGDKFINMFSSERVTFMNKIGIKTSRAGIQIGRTSLIGIIESVKNWVLDWALEMEKNGIVGENMTFNTREKAEARATMTNFHIINNGNFAGQIGNNNTSENISLNVETKNRIVQELRKIQEKSIELVDAGADPKISDIIEATIIETQQEKPDKTKLKNLSSDIRSALSGAAGNLTATGAMAVAEQVFKLLGI
jgi:chaperonin cofactor prefoldin